MICRNGGGCEQGESSRQYFLTADPIGQRSREQRKSRGGERVACHNDSGASRGCAQVRSHERKKRRNQLRVRNSQEKDAEENERHFPLELFATGHARILTLFCNSGARDETGV